MTMKIVSWNVRNLSATMARPGVRGRGLLLDYRIDTVINNIKKWEPDIVFLLEGGPDGKHVAECINKALWWGYKAFSSPVTEGETYIVVYKKGIENYFNRTRLIGDFQNNGNIYRQGYLLALNINNTSIFLLVLHAPSPNHPLKVRIGVIKNVIQHAKEIAKDNPMLFMGDLNIKENESKELRQGLNSEGFFFAGPYDNEKPASTRTSLRKFTTIAKSGGFFETTGSQPYDQFWMSPKPGSPPAVSILYPNVLAPETRNYNSWITKGMKQALENFNPKGQELRSAKVPIKYKGSDLESNYEWFRTLYNLFGNTLLVKTKTGAFQKRLNKLGGLLTNSIPVKEWWFYYEQVKKKIQPYKLGDPNLPENILNKDYKKLIALLRDFTFYQALIDGIINFKTGGKVGYGLQKTVVYEHGISDHLPIEIKLPISIPTSQWSTDSSHTYSTPSSQGKMDTRPDSSDMDTSPDLSDDEEEQ